MCVNSQADQSFRRKGKATWSASPTGSLVLAVVMDVVHTWLPHVVLCPSAGCFQAEIVCCLPCCCLLCHSVRPWERSLREFYHSALWAYACKCRVNQRTQLSWTCDWLATCGGLIVKSHMPIKAVTADALILVKCAITERGHQPPQAG